MNVALRFAVWLGLGTLWLIAPARAVGSDPASVETSLLHRRPELRGIEIWNRTTQEWRPLSLPEGKIVVLNLWSHSCEPCLAEMPYLAQAARRWSARGVVFLSVADPPEEMTRDKVIEFWKHRFFFARPGQPCPGTRTPPLANTIPLRCPLTLPDADPGRNTDVRLLRTIPVQTKPLTLLLDPHGTVRQAFIGSLELRPGALDEALERLRAAVAAESCAARP